MDSTTYNKAVFYAPMDGAEGSFRIIDKKGHLVVPYGYNTNPYLSTAQYAPLEGNFSSLYFRGNRCFSPNHVDFHMGEGPFTIALWVRPAAIGSTQVLIEKRTQGSTYAVFTLMILAAGTVYAQVQTFNDVTTTSTYTITSTATLSADRWYHLAFVRTDNLSFALYIDGTAAGTSAGSVYPLATNAGALSLGGSHGTSSTTSPFRGYIDDVLIVRDECLYPSAFTRPTKKYFADWLGSISGTVLDEAAAPQRALIRIADRLTGAVLAEAVSDASGEYVVTELPTTDVTVSRLRGTPPPWVKETRLLFHADGVSGDYALPDACGHPGFQYSTSLGGIVTSTYAPLTGNTASYGNTTNYTQIFPTNDLLLFDDDFSIDFWVNRGSSAMYILGPSSWASPSKTWRLYISSSGYLNFEYSTDGSATIYVAFSPAISSGAWHHIALSRSGALIYAFVDGVALGDPQAMTGEIWVTSANLIVCNSTSGGYVDELRLVIGAAIYTEAFTPPTTPYSLDFSGDEAPLIHDGVIPG